MKISVDRQLCDNHGQCALIAEEVFKINSSGVLEFDENPSDAFRSDIMDAIDICPVQAIILL
jgi:ferredoxin